MVLFDQNHTIPKPCAWYHASTPRMTRKCMAFLLHISTLVPIYRSIKHCGNRPAATTILFQAMRSTQVLELIVAKAC